MKRFIKNKNVLFILGILFILLLWFLLSLCFDTNNMIFPGPIVSFKAMFELLGRKVTYTYLGKTLLRLVIGFSVSFALAIVLGSIAGHYPSVYTFLKPFMNVCKSIPTVALVYLFIIVFQPMNAPIYVVMLISLPILFEAIYQGINKTDPFVLSAARVDGASKLKQIIRIRLPLAIPYILVGISSSLAMSFKVEIMAEVLAGMTKGGIGAAIGGLTGEANLVLMFGYTLIILFVVLIFTFVSEHLKKVFIDK